VAKHNETGKLGEAIAERFLRIHDFTILKRNAYYGKKEVDILTEKNGVIRIVEVKTVRIGSSIAPEDNFTKDKMKNLCAVLRALESYDEFHGKRLQIDFLAVTLDEDTRKASCRLVQNIDFPSNLF